METNNLAWGEYRVNLKVVEDRTQKEYRGQIMMGCEYLARESFRDTDNSNFRWIPVSF